MAESPLISGSGLEFSVEPDDTVILLLKSVSAQVGGVSELLRMEPMNDLLQIQEYIGIKQAQ